MLPDPWSAWKRDSVPQVSEGLCEACPQEWYPVSAGLRVWRERRVSHFRVLTKLQADDRSQTQVGAVLRACCASRRHFSLSHEMVTLRAVFVRGELAAFAIAVLAHCEIRTTASTLCVAATTLFLVRLAFPPNRLPLLLSYNTLFPLSRCDPLLRALFASVGP